MSRSLDRDFKCYKKMFVVIAYKFGESMNHSYTVGIFDKKEKAIKCANSHSKYRGGKYDCVVEQCFLNYFNNNKDEYSENIYSTFYDKDY